MSSEDEFILEPVPQKRFSLANDENIDHGIILEPFDDDPTPEPDDQPPKLPSELAFLSFFSIIGVLIRLGLLELFTYPSPLLAPLIPVQWVGCLLLGFVSAPPNASFVKHKYCRKCFQFFDFILEVNPCTWE